MGSGWVKLPRSLLDSSFWCGEVFSKGQAYCDLLLLANFMDVDGTRKGKRFTYKRGAVHISQQALARRWKWSDNRVSRFLRMLEKNGFIKLESDSQGTVLTLCQYDLEEVSTNRSKAKITAANVNPMQRDLYQDFF